METQTLLVLDEVSSRWLAMGFTHMVFVSEKYKKITKVELMRAINRLATKTPNGYVRKPKFVVTEGGLVCLTLADGRFVTLQGEIRDRTYPLAIVASLRELLEMDLDRCKGAFYAVTDQTTIYYKIEDIIRFAPQIKGKGFCLTDDFKDISQYAFAFGQMCPINVGDEDL